MNSILRSMFYCATMWIVLWTDIFIMNAFGSAFIIYDFFPFVVEEKKVR